MPRSIKTSSFDIKKDIAPVISTFSSPNTLVVNPSVPAKTLAEFIAYAKANPGKINYASFGVGSAPNMNGELLKLTAGIDMVHVPYRQSPVADLLSGQVQAFFGPMPITIALVKSGKLRALAVSSAKRSDALPDVPAVAESYPGFEANIWHGIGAPKGTPKDIIAQAQQGDQRHSRRAGYQREVRQDRRRGARRHAGGLRQVHRQRDRQVGQGHQGGATSSRSPNTDGRSQGAERQRAARRGARAVRRSSRARPATPSSLQLDVNPEVVRRGKAGEAFDVAVGNPSTIEQLIAAGKVVAGSLADIGTAGLAVGVRAGARQARLVIGRGLQARAARRQGGCVSGARRQRVVFRRPRRPPGHRERDAGQAQADAGRRLRRGGGARRGGHGRGGGDPHGRRAGIDVVGPIPEALQTKIGFAAGLSASTAAARHRQGADRLP